MATRTTGDAFGSAICDALVIDKRFVTAINVLVEAQQPVTIEVTYAPTLTDAQLCAIADALIVEGKSVQVILKRGA